MQGERQSTVCRSQGQPSMTSIAYLLLFIRAADEASHKLYAKQGWYGCLTLPKTFTTPPKKNPTKTTGHSPTKPNKRWGKKKRMKSVMQIKKTKTKRGGWIVDRGRIRRKCGIWSRRRGSMNNCLRLINWAFILEACLLNFQNVHFIYWDPLTAGCWQNYDL